VELDCFPSTNVFFYWLMLHFLASAMQEPCTWWTEALWQLQDVMRPQFLVLTLYICILFACLYRMFSHLSMFLHFFLTYFLPYLSYALRVDPLHFQAGCRKKVTKPGFSLLCLFCVVVHFFWLVNACFCCVTFGFSMPSQEIGLRKRLRNDLFCVEWDVKPPLSQWMVGGQKLQ